MQMPDGGKADGIQLTALQVWSKVWSKQKNSQETCVSRLFSCGGGDGSRTHVRKAFSVGISGCRRSTTFPPRHAGRQANASVAS